MFQDEKYNKIIKKTVIAFGSLFSNIKINREDNGNVKRQTINVPLAYGPKDKAIVRSDADPDFDKQHYITLPRLSFEITGYNYDASRKTNKLGKIICQSADGGRKETFSPVPYNLNISLYLLTNSNEDSFQVVEQILPMFTPDYTISIKAIEDFNIIQDIPINLDSVTFEDDYEGSYEVRRLITHTFNFTLKLNFYRGGNDVGVIEKVIVNVEHPDRTYTAEGTLPGDPIIESWTDTI